jgi:hypothetical protein
MDSVSFASFQQNLFRTEEAQTCTVSPERARQIRRFYRERITEIVRAEPHDGVSPMAQSLPPFGHTAGLIAAAGAFPQPARKEPTVRKQLIGLAQSPAATDAEDRWLDLDRHARVEVTSEDDRHPIEAALLPGAGEGWRAAATGAQTIRVIFDRPERVHRIVLVFEEREVERSQEFVLSWRAGEAGPSREIARQQWNFSPSGSVREVEDYRVDLRDASVLELTIAPDRGAGAARASLAEWRIA